MFDKSVFCGVDVAFVDFVEDVAMIVPDALQIVVIGVEIEFDGLVGIPIGFEQAEHKRIFQVPEDAQMKLAVFDVGDLDPLVIELALRLVDA